MYSNLPFTGAPLIYIALGLFFLTAGMVLRIIDFARTKTAQIKNRAAK
ncbi:hypothetical protein LCGC14_1239570 [marine sediment metagenome]|uniref:Uncharacterized protein n=1 Tax=marine sediment metagenome TaxID=412755 RepID=A0A0F9NNG0_9ZZZZ